MTIASDLPSDLPSHLASHLASRLPSHPPPRRRAVPCRVATLIGNALGHYDFAIYAYFSLTIALTAVTGNLLMPGIYACTCLVVAVAAASMLKETGHAPLS